MYWFWNHQLIIYLNNQLSVINLTNIIPNYDAYLNSPKRFAGILLFLAYLKNTKNQKCLLAKLPRDIIVYIYNFI